MQPADAAECPFCFGRMQLEAGEKESWMVCPNGCPTEFRIADPAPAALEATAEPQARAAGSSK